MASENVFKDYKPKEFNELCKQLCDLSHEAMPKALSSKDAAREPFIYLTGDNDVQTLNGGLHYKRYYNMAWAAWDCFIPKFVDRPPRFLVKQLIEETRLLAEACSQHMLYKTKKYNYQEMIIDVCQDAYHLPIAYGRHYWDDKLGVTLTKRFNPCDVQWDHTATDIKSAKYVIERHKCKRYEFRYKYGKKLADKVKKCENSEQLKKPESKSDRPLDLDEIEYYLMWSKHCGYRRVYLFLKEWPEDWDDKWLHISKEDGKPGEPWGLQFDEDEWHLTELQLGRVNGRIGGMSNWQASKTMYLMMQDLWGAIAVASEESGKKILAYNAAIGNFVEKVSAAGGTLSFAPFDPQLAGAEGADKMLKLIEFPGPDPGLLKAHTMAQDFWANISGFTAINQGAAENVETAAEANKLSESAANRIKAQQSAVEQWVSRVGRKELACDLGRVPRKTSLRVNRSEYDEGQGEYPDKNQPQEIHDVPYRDAILLEKGVVDPDEGMEQLRLRDEAKAKAILAAGFGAGMAPGSSEAIAQAGEQAAAQVPVSPEVEVRLKHKVPIDAEVKITNPGAEQFIGERLAVNWPEDMSPRQIDSSILVTIQLGSSGSMDRLQNVNEKSIINKLIEPRLVELQMWDQVAILHNAVIDASEDETLKDCKLTGAMMRDAYAKIQEQQAQQMEAQMAAQNAPKPPDPNVMAKAEAEVTKSNNSVTTGEQKLELANVKAADNEARDRHKSEMQLRMAQMNGMMGPPQ
jgi:DNA-binding protein YbaB